MTEHISVRGRRVSQQTREEAVKRRAGVIAGVVVTAAIAMGGLAHSASAQEASEVNAVKAANAAFYAALSARDIGAVMKSWSTKSEVRHIGPRNQDVDVGLDAIKKTIQATMEAFPELEVTPEQVHIRIVGSVAWVSDIEKTQRKNKAGEVQSGSNFGTSIFEKQGGKWLMVHHHASAIPR